MISTVPPEQAIKLSFILFFAAFLIGLGGIGIMLKGKEFVFGE